MRGLIVLELKYLLWHRHILFPSHYDESITSDNFVIAVDVLSIIYHHECDVLDSAETCIGKVGEVLNFLAHCSFDVIPIIDGKHSSTKLASYSRRTSAIKSICES